MNLVGEHTDYNEGLVLPTLIPQRVVVRITHRSDEHVSLRTDASLPPAEAALGELRPNGTWSDHVLGVVAVLRDRGHALRGFDADITSTIPIGAGLSSSAALAVATLRALRGAFDLAIDDGDIALIAHESEDRFVGAHVGLMDQLVCSLGREGEALFIDLRDRSTRSVSLAPLDVEIAVIDSGIRHEHATGEYNARRRECEDAARALGERTLREVTLERDLHALPPTLARRVHHVVSENERVVAAVKAIDRGDAAALGMILNASHASLRDDYEVSVPAIDGIVAAAQRDTDVYGARIVGGGFGGSVLALARRGAARAAAERVVAMSSGRAILPVR